MSEPAMKDDLHRCVWYAYRLAIGADASWDPQHAFRSALEVTLRWKPELDATAACQETARMIMMRPRGIGNRGRVMRPARRSLLQLAA